jgi:putative FmdB family regulatory protein
MPIYAFACNSCGHAFERLQKLSDPDPAACPACAELTVQRQLTAPQFRLSGSGWYETDFKKDGETKRNLVDKGEGAAAAAAPSDSKSEVKDTSSAVAPVTKPETKPASQSNDSV